MSLPYLDRLDSERQEVFRKLKPFADSFVLAGGTAIMLQIGHRISYDFDCFTQNKLTENLFPRLKRVFKNIRQTVRTENVFQFVTGNGIELHFVSFPYQPLQPPVPSNSVSLARLDDLAANKAFTIGRRPAWRDYVDLFFFMKWELYSIDTIIEFAEKKFTDEFNPKLFLQQLTYFSDLDIQKIVFLKESYSKAEIKEFLEKQTLIYVKKAIS